MEYIREATDAVWTRGGLTQQDWHWEYQQISQAGPEATNGTPNQNILSGQLPLEAYLNKQALFMFGKIARTELPEAENARIQLSIRVSELVHAYTVSYGAIS